MDYFEKKQWIRIVICALAVAVIVLAMTGVFGGNGPLMYDPSAKSLPAGATEAEATEQGFGGDVTVHVTLDGSFVQGLTIDTPDETEGLGKRASEAEFSDQFIGKAGPFAFGEDGIEALSGATVTSTAALKAINRAVTGEESAAEPTEEPAAEPAEEPAEVPAEEPAAESAAASSATDVTEQGFGGDVTVHVTLDGDTIQALTIDTPDETEGLGKRASGEEFTSQFIGKSGPFTFGEDGIEALSGATVTSNAALKAINNAVDGEAAEPETETAEPAAEQEAAAETKEEPKAEASNGQTYGVYRSVKQNDFSTVTVTASAKNGELTAVKITSEGEEGKDLLTDAIREEWAKAILESGSAAPDTITGATLKFSAASVQEAMTEILAEMNSEATEPAAEHAEEPAAEPAEEPAEVPAEEPAAENTAASSATDVTEQGFGGDVTVHVTLDGDKIQALTIDTPDETEGLGKRASGEEFTSQFIGKSGPFTFGEDGIEALSGATVTSNAALKAINSAVGGEAAEPEAETAEPAAEPETTAEAKEEPKAEASNGQAYGVYRSTKQNDFSTVTVTASAKNGELTAVKITSEGEEGKDLLTDAIREEWAKAILESGSAAPDAITGATLKFSAASVQEAMTEILAEMSGEAAEPETETAEPAAEPETAAETKEEPKAEASNGQAYGVYRSVKQNDFSTVTVTASAKNGELTAVKITSEGEEGKDLLTDAIREEWAKAILESGSAAPDAITGATLKFSAASVQEAMTEILAEMSGEAVEPAAEAEAEPAEAPAAEEPAAEVPAEEPAAEEPAAEVPAEESAAEEPAAEASAVEEPAEKVPAAYAGYKAEKENQFSRITVIAYAEKGQLVSVKILSEGEGNNDLLTDAVREEWAKAILESGSASPDAVTGATLTFSAGSVQEAIAKILTDINGEASEPAAEAPAEKEPAEETPAAEEAPAESSANGNELLAAIAVSMGNEKENSYVTDYLEQDPYLVNIYEGYGFAKDYGSARGHYYTLADVEKTQRPHAKANCLTCKTPDMHKMIEEQGVSVYSMPFDEVMAQMTQPIGCYTCHGADNGNGGKMVVTHQYVNEALGENTAEVKAASLSCGQCHIEYYFTPEDSEAMMPYHSVAEMLPEAILAYYDEIGFADWEQPGTGTKMLKAQHPELETYSYGKHASMLSCADCHMPTAATENGTQYHDHHLVSPLSSETLLAKCAACHGSAENTIALVQDIQTKVTARETEVGNKLSALKDELTVAVSAGKMSGEELDAVRKLHREAQWFFDFCYVENSEGAHNSELAYRCLDTSETKIDEAMGLLASAGKSDVNTEAQEETAETPAEETSAEEPAADPAAEEPAANDGNP